MVLLVVDSVGGLTYPPIVAREEEAAGPWQRLFDGAGLGLGALRGVTSDSAGHQHKVEPSHPTPLLQ